MSINLSKILNEYSSEVTANRTAFLDGLNKLPSPLGTSLVEQYKQRVGREQGKPVLGEYAPWLLADILAISDRKIISKIALPWLNIFAYTYFIDDIIDQVDKKVSPPLMVATGVLLSQGLSELYQSVASGKDVVKYLSEQCVQTALAAVEEIQNHRGKFKEFSRAEIDNIGRKVSLLRLCAASLLAADGKTEVKDEDLTLIYRLGTGMQLLDDLCDWKEDWSQKSYTYPLTFAMLRTEKNGTDIEKFSYDHVLATMIITGALENTLDIIVDCVADILKSGTVVGNSVGHRFLNGIVHNCQWLKEEAMITRRVCLEEKVFCVSSDWFGELLERERVQYGIHSIQPKIRIVAQSS